MLYRFSLFASSLLATLPLTTFAQTTLAAAAPKAVTIMTGPVGNAGNGAAATSVPAAPLSVTSSLVAGGVGAGTAVGGSNLSTSAAPAAAASTAGVIGNGQVAVWVVKVGGTNNELVFSPSTVTAKVGEMVQFQFYSNVCILHRLFSILNLRANYCLLESFCGSGRLYLALYTATTRHQCLLQWIHAHG